MHRWLVISAVVVSYYALAWYSLLVYDAGIVLTAVFLFGVPSVILARFSYAPSAVIVSVTVFGLGIGLLLEGVAQINGLWYSVGFEGTRLFGLIPAEVLVSTILQVTFLALLYELIFDDGVYTVSSARTRFAAIGVFVVGVLALLAIHVYVLGGVSVPYSYIWIIGSILASSIAALGIYRVYSALFFDRLVHFAIAGAIPLLLALSLAVANGQKVFASTDQYLVSFIYKGNIVPLEEIILAFALPFFVATIYELYLDDQS